MRRLLVLGLVSAMAMALRQRCSTFEVQGWSMAPALLPGDYLLILRLPGAAGWPRRGWMVVARRPERPDLTIVKRVASVEGEAAARGAGRGEPTAGAGIFLVGDNAAASTDSREFGPAPRSAIVGVVWARYRPLRRLSLLI